MDVLVALVAAAESKTKAEAAGRLKITVSALDKRFRSASNLFGTPLVQQAGNEIRLTEAGGVFYSSAARSVEFASLAEQSIRTHLLLKTDHILVGHSSYLPPEVLRLVHGLKLQEQPRIRVGHRAGLTALTVKSVLDGEMVGGFGFLPFSAPDLVVRKIWDEPLMVRLPSSHPAASRTVIRAEDLHGQSFIAVGRDPLPGVHRELDNYLGTLGVNLRIEADAFAPTEALNLVEQGIGICVLSRSSAMQRRGVTVRPLWTTALKRESAYFYRDDNRSPLLNALSDAVLKRARELGSAGGFRAGRPG